MSEIQTIWAIIGAQIIFNLIIIVKINAVFKIQATCIAACEAVLDLFFQLVKDIREEREDTP